MEVITQVQPVVIEGKLQFLELHLILNRQAAIGKKDKFLEPQAKPFHADVLALLP